MWLTFASLENSSTTRGPVGGRDGVGGAAREEVGRGRLLRKPLNYSISASGRK